MKPFHWHRAVLEGLLADRERLPHAMLIHGRAGIGKAGFARALAAAVLCERPTGGGNRTTGLACGECPSCHWFSQGNHPDYREIVPEAAAEDDAEAGDEGAKPEKAKSLVIKIDQIRAVADFIALSTHRAGYRVLTIRPAESLHPNAANALLKTLEEPPARTLILLVSDQPARLLPTIRSRCRPVPLPAPGEREALDWLEAQGVEDAPAALAAAGGAPLLACDLAAPEEAELRRRVVTELSRPGGAEPQHFAAAVERGALERFVYWMQTWVHDLIRLRLAGEIRHHRAARRALEPIARNADLERLLDLERELAEARRLSSHPLNPRLLAEHLLMAYNRATSRSPQ